MKRKTTEKGPPTNRKDAEKVWLECWKDMEQGRIQRWIERIVRHVKKVNDLQGDNCYREGSTEEPIEIGKHGGRKGPVETIGIARIIETEDLLRRC
jgi:hypothetical protein